jgi:tRNA A37 methylthiotransferase MiaB
VGFPDETEEDFQQTLDLVKYGNFDMVYIWIYSQRPWTLAAKNYPDTISRSIKRDRRNRLNDLLKDISRQNNEQEIGKTKEILINNISTSKHWNISTIEGYTDNMKQVIIEYWNMETWKNGKWKKNHSIVPSFHRSVIQVGEFIHVKITRAIPFKVYGEIAP